MEQQLAKFWNDLTPAQRIIIYTVEATLNMTHGPISAEAHELFLEDLVKSPDDIGHLRYYNLANGLYQKIAEILTENPEAKFKEVVRSLIPVSNIIKPL